MSGQSKFNLPSQIASQSEVILVDRNLDSVKCNGGNSVAGHPLVYYRFDGSNQVKCLYCDRVFTKETN